MQKSNKIWSKCLVGLSLVLCAILGFGTVSYAAESYSYDIWGNVVAAPAAYELERTIYGADLGVDNMATATDIFYRDGKFYLAVSGAIVIADEEFENISYIKEFEKEDGSKSAVSVPTGLFVTDEGHIYICEQAKGEIIEFDENGKP